MSVYLQDIPLSEAKERFHQAIRDAGRWRLLGIEAMPLDENALGRILAEPVWARISSPNYPASAMDGFAIRAEDTGAAMPTAPVTLSMGVLASYVDTGDALPAWADAVVPIELVEALDEEDQISQNNRHPAKIRLRASLAPWSHIRPMGEDIVAGQLVLPAGQTLRPVDLGAMVACGYSQAQVSRQPRVGIIPTGSELVPPGSDGRPGEIVEYNSIVLAAQVKGWGGIPRRYPIIADDLGMIRECVLQAVEENDLILLNAGSSAGTEDFSASVVTELGELLVHGVAVRPGHPVILGLIWRKNGDKIPIIGVPGYPVSAALTAEIFVEPLLALWLGRPALNAQEITARLTRKVTSPPGYEDYMRVVVGKVGDDLLAAPLSRAAGTITSLVLADGITILPAGIQGLEAGTSIKVRLYTSLKESERTIFAIGSHDMTLDILAQFISARGRRLVSSNVGSLGGLAAIRRNEAHLAGSHLLDPQTGEYNLAYLRRYLPDTPVRLVIWANREQGLMVKKGNPKSIQSLADIARPEVIYVNRQRGAGTRVLLDYQLHNLDIPASSVHGYAQEEFTHLAVAAAVASGRADTGLGIPAAASALDLDFIPLFQERYDLVIPTRFLQGDLLNPLFDLMADSAFRKAVAAMPGYDITHMGEVVPTPA
jgi:putative molybdopterin biosynthesis protein